MAKYNEIPIWILEEIVARGTVTPQESYFWLCAVAKTQAQELHSQGKVENDQRRFVHNSVAKLNSAAPEGYPFSCPLCSEESSQVHPLVVTRTIVLRPDAGVIKIDLFYGVLNVTELKEDRTPRFRVCQFTVAAGRKAPKSLDVTFGTTRGRSQAT